MLQGLQLPKAVRHAGLCCTPVQVGRQAEDEQHADEACPGHADDAVAVVLVGQAGIGGGVVVHWGVEQQALRVSLIENKAGALEQQALEHGVRQGNNGSRIRGSKRTSSPDTVIAYLPGRDGCGGTQLVPLHRSSLSRLHGPPTSALTPATTACRKPTLLRWPAEGGTAWATSSRSSK